MFAMLRNSFLGLLIASAIAMALCALFLAASFIGVSMPRSAWAQGWLPVQVETDVPTSSRRKVTRFPSLERAVAKAGPGDTVTILSSIDVVDSIPVDKDLSVVIAQGCTMRSVVGEGHPVFAVEPGCKDFVIAAGHASRIVFGSPDAGSLLAVFPATSPTCIALRGINVHGAALTSDAALLDIAARPAELSLENCDVFNLRAPVVRTRAGAQASVAVADSRLERIKGCVAIDLSASSASALLVRDSVLIGSLGCDLIHMARPNLLLCDNSYLSALSANPVVCGDDVAAAASPLDSASLELRDVSNRAIA